MDVVSLQDEVCCAICIDMLRDARFLPCFHSFCCECVASLAQHAQQTESNAITCPVCRSSCVLASSEVSALPVDRRAMRLVSVLQSKPIAPVVAPARTVSDTVVDRTHQRASPAAPFRDPLELFRRAEGQERNGSFADAFELFKAAAELGNSRAQFKLGKILRHGTHGQCADEALAIFWFQSAANQGHVLAMRHAGECFHNGHGVDRDLEQAGYWYSRAAQAGDASGRELMHAVALEQSRSAAASAVQQSAAAVDLHRDSNTGEPEDWFAKGWAAEQQGNYDETLRCWTIASELGHARATKNLDLMRSWNWSHRPQRNASSQS
ncbi:protein YbeQ [Porphyridium purpureum]|uniref:Protein YbeQ n=1 Tax=Porphyridium purpureum TaxID=35688 RepID=A0A5J4Z2C6_PORPP|nr:protein YbeQ [Porphyridium purpureum]|eukprot:POR8708..scf208_2